MDIIPFVCPECGGKVSSHKGKGRTQKFYPGYPGFSVPEDMDIPQCDSCGETFVRADLEDQLEAVLFPQVLEYERWVHLLGRGETD